ncbi:MAG TPA: AraC family transcriptional regulator ligand-binding domain-containing protein [Polyangiales bacterium]|nr:AraC family transcriptional regulator ligand-binding domain-containing protein [Polyangiales bacterium]
MLRDVADRSLADGAAGGTAGHAALSVLQPSCSRRLVRPFVQFLLRQPSFAAERDRLRSTRTDGRVPIDRAHAALLHWAERLGDPALGLNAGALMCVGAGGALDYALYSASSLRASIAAAERYVCLYDDALTAELDVQQQRAVLRLEHMVKVPRIARDFLISAWYASFLRVQLAESSDAEVWFSGEAPPYRDAYERVFAPLRVRFNRRCDGFTFPAAELDRALPGADVQLHGIHCKHVESLIAELPAHINFSARVCELVAGGLGEQRPTAVSVARELRMSRRTLVRRLSSEGTSFSEQLEHVRRELALHFVANSSLPLTEITKSLSFSHVQGFHRAFKRWTGQSPIRYRKDHLAARHEADTSATPRRSTV